MTLNEGYFFNNILPFRMGELARAFLMGRRSRLGMFYVLSTIVVERSYDLVIAASLLLLTLPLALKLEWARPIAIAIAGNYPRWPVRRLPGSAAPRAGGSQDRTAGRALGVGAALGSTAAAFRFERLFGAHPR